MKTILLSCLLFLLLPYSYSQFPTKLSFQVGVEYIYDLKGTLDARGQDGTDSTVTGGAISSMNSTMIILCSNYDRKKDSYLFVMNMFDTYVGVGESGNTDFESHRIKGKLGNVYDDDCYNEDTLGCDMYFEQLSTGEIPHIWYNTLDSPYFIQVKVGAINSLQTLVLPVNQQKVVSLPDPIGVHKSNFAASQDKKETQLLEIQQTFQQGDFSSFADPHLKPKNVHINGLTTTKIHQSGFIKQAQVQQVAVFVNANRFSKKTSNTTGFNSDVRSAGNLDVLFKRKALTNQRIKSSSMFEILSPPKWTKSTIFDYSRKIAEEKVLNIDLKSVIYKALSAKTTTLAMPSMRKLSLYLSQNPEKIETISLFLSSKGLTKEAMRRIFYILGQAGTPKAQEILVEKALQSEKSVQIQAIWTLASIKFPTTDTIQAISQLISKQSEISDVASLALGTLLRSAVEQNPSLQPLAQALLLNNLNQAIKSKKSVSSSLFAIKNAGPSVVPIESIPRYIFENHETLEIAKKALKDYPLPLVKENVGGDFPFNRSYSPSLTLGGSVLSATLGADLFLGSNFNCKEKNFNYKALADLKADVTFFDKTANAFLAEALYAKANGQLIGNDLLLSIFGNVLYDRHFPIVDCNEHTYSIGHTGHGFSISYTLWVSMIPVTFSVSVDINIDLSWGWQICDNDLSAMVELIPDSQLIFTGSAVIDLLIIRGGVEVVGDIDLRIIPSAYVHGSECVVGVEAREDDKPMTAKIAAFYQTQKCKYWIFDCHWGPNHEKDFWTWSSEGQHRVLVKEEWPIHI